MNNSITLPHSANQLIPIEKFLAAWIIWVERFHGSTDWENFHFPFDWQTESLSTLLEGGRLSGLDAMLRFLASPEARNTMQASYDFLNANAQWLEKCDDAVSSRGNQVIGAVLTPESVAPWKALSEQEKNLLLKKTTQLASEVFESVWGIDGVDSEEEIPSAPDLHDPDVCIPNNSSGLGWVDKFVERVHADPFVAHYLRKPIKSKIYGWGNRLESYFWPTPVDGPSVTTDALSSHIDALQLLANKVLVHTPWTPEEQVLAVHAAKGIFQWGRVLRSAPTDAQVRATMEMAIHREAKPALPPMNSTWTKLASFATDHLTLPHVIWDSRVATSVTWRLEQLFAAAGLSKVPYGSSCIPNELGPMQVGRGGTRPRTLKFNWKNAYGSWPAQFAASEFVRSVRDHLNANPAKYPKSKTHAATPWTVREVEQVLFMDGY